MTWISLAEADIHHSHEDLHLSRVTELHPNRGASRKGTSKVRKHAGAGWNRCSQCGGDIKIKISPKRNPHSSKLGRNVTLKDHDLCRQCWRRIVRMSRERVLLDQGCAKVWSEHREAPFLVA